MPYGIARGMLRALPLGGLIALAACGNWARVGTDPQPNPTQNLAAVLDESTIFRRIGRLAATGAIPFIGNVALLPGPADSVLAVLGVSLENRNLGFERQGDQGFVARYRVDLTFRRDSGATNRYVPAGASIVSPSTSKVAFPSSTTYSSS